MAFLEIPLFPDLDAPYRENLLLEGQIYIFDFRFNTRMSAWIIDIYDQDETPLVMGRLCLVDIPLLQQARHVAVPHGALFCFDTLNQKREPSTFEDLGTRVLMFYLEEADVLAA